MMRLKATRRELEWWDRRKSTSLRVNCSLILFGCAAGYSKDAALERWASGRRENNPEYGYNIKVTERNSLRLCQNPIYILCVCETCSLSAFTLTVFSEWTEPCVFSSSSLRFCSRLRTWWVRERLNKCSWSASEWESDSTLNWLTTGSPLWSLEMFVDFYVSCETEPKRRAVVLQERCVREIWRK